MNKKNEDSLEDFDLLVARASFLMYEIKEIAKQRAAIIQRITDLLIKNNTQKLTASSGQVIVLRDVPEVAMAELPEEDKRVLEEWCRENNLSTMNYHRVIKAIDEGLVPPIDLKMTKKKAFFGTGSKLIPASIDIHKESEKAITMKFMEGRNAHIRELADVGLTQSKIAKMYRISNQYVGRIIKKERGYKRHKQIVL